ncbi:MAG: hypothetical protein M3Z46_02255 [Actinomycetota bacterium]|nr:hypothetical protein [Actinomycetota bacterium]
MAPPPFSIVRLLGASFVQLLEAPGVWLTNFFDNAEDIWDIDPLLSDDDELRHFRSSL